MMRGLYTCRGAASQMRKSLKFGHLLSFSSFAFAASIKLCKNKWHRINFCQVLYAFTDIILESF